MNEPQRHDLLHLLDWHNRQGVLIVAILLGIIIGGFGGLL
jgi:hypothetical protein